MTDNNEKPNQNTSSPRKEPLYLKALNAVRDDSMVGQTFIITTKMQQPKANQLNQCTQAKRIERELLEILKSKRDDSKVGESFIITTKMQPPIAAPSEQNLSPLMEKTILDIMKAYGVDRQKAINILNQPM